MAQAAPYDDGTAAILLRALDVLDNGIEQLGPDQIVGPVLHCQNCDSSALISANQGLFGHIALPLRWLIKFRRRWGLGTRVRPKPRAHSLDASQTSLLAHS